MVHNKFKKKRSVQQISNPYFHSIIRIVFLLICVSILLPATIFADQEKLAPGREMAKQAINEKRLWITTDHTQHKILKQRFTSGPEVTKACLSCHNQAALQFHKAIHWTWMDPITEKSDKLGKGGLSINNF